MFSSDIEEDIQVIVPNEWNTTECGNFFEGVVNDIFKRMRWETKQQLRVTGMEIDILAKNPKSAEEALVECKFYASKKIEANIIFELVGKASAEGVSHALLFHTSQLTKDAEGRVSKIEKDGGRVGSLFFEVHGPNDLLDRLKDVHSLIPPSEIYSRLNEQGLSQISKALLIVSPFQFAWVFLTQDDVAYVHSAEQQNSGWVDDNLLKTLRVSDSWTEVDLIQGWSDDWLKEVRHSSSRRTTQTFNLLKFLRQKFPQRHTYSNYEASIDFFLDFATDIPDAGKAESRAQRLRELPTDKIERATNRTMVERWIRHREQEFLPSTVKKDRAAIVAFADILHSSGYILLQTYAEIKRIKVFDRNQGNESSAILLTRDDIGEILSIARMTGKYPSQRQRNFLIMHLLCTYLTTAQELAQIVWADVDLDSGQLYITGSKERTLVLEPQTLQLLKDWQDIIFRQLDECPSDSFVLRQLTRSGNLFREGLGIGQRGIQNIFRAIADEAGFPDLIYHDIRDSKVFFLLKENSLLRDLSNLLGYDSLKEVHNVLQTLDDKYQDLWDLIMTSDYTPDEPDSDTSPS